MTRGSVTVLLTLALAIAGASAALAQKSDSPAEHGVGRLITQTAKRGTLTPVRGKHHLALKLRGVAPQVVWFDDRPARRTGQIPLARFVRSWAGFGFGEVPPNAALTLLNAADDEDTVVLKLGAPHYKRKTRTVRYPAKLLHRATGNLSHLERRRDDHVPRHFTAASLFIDDAGYGLPPGCQPGLPYITCTYTSSTRLSVDSMVSQLESALGRQIDSSTPLWTQAWGGRGAQGADSGSLYPGAYGGYAGYAIAVTSIGTLSGDTLYLYVGASGSKHANSGGQGGASTIVSTQAISSIAAFPGGVQVVAGGSGGGGKGCPGRGGAGGVAIAAASLGDVNGSGQSGQGANVGGGGSGGNGGAAGGKDDSAGTDGLGGYGGPGKLSSAVGWVNGGAVDPAAAGWATGAGGGGHDGGGGGYGGGGAGASCGGGGGGGSWAHALVKVDGLLFVDPDVPTDSEQGDGAQSRVVLTFHLS